MADFTGISKDDKTRLTEAATMYRNLTGKDVSRIVSNIPVVDTTDVEAEQAKAKVDLERQAEMTRKMEQAQQEYREASMPKTATKDEDKDAEPAEGKERARRAS